MVIGDEGEDTWQAGRNRRGSPILEKLATSGLVFFAQSLPKSSRCQFYYAFYCRNLGNMVWVEQFDGYAEHRADEVMLCLITQFLVQFNSSDVIGLVIRRVWPG